MNRTMPESKIHPAGLTDYDPKDLQHHARRVVHVGTDNEICQIDSEVATPLGASTVA